MCSNSRSVVPTPLTESSVITPTPFSRIFVETLLVRERIVVQDTGLEVYPGIFRLVYRTIFPLFGFVSIGVTIVSTWVYL